jgi:hypothetical protein
MRWALDVQITVSRSTIGKQSNPRKLMSIFQATLHACLSPAASQWALIHGYFEQNSGPCNAAALKLHPQLLQWLAKPASPRAQLHLARKRMSWHLTLRV